MASCQSSSFSPSIAALVVTYNRRELLVECLDAISGQKYAVDRTIVVDNASSDGTNALFTAGSRFDSPLIDYHLMESNLGGAGGFKEGLRLARECGCEWVWLMDDDCVAEPETLLELVHGAEIVTGERPSFLASVVYGNDDEPMNVATVDTRPSANGYPDWYRRVVDGLVRIQSATFVSLLISMNAIREVGLPIGSFFIWGDDSEYTSRLVTYYGPAYLVGASRMLHKRANAKALDIRSETNERRLCNFRYFIRNNLVVDQVYSSKKRALSNSFHNLVGAFTLLVSGTGDPAVRRARARAVFLGTVDYLSGSYDLEDLGVLLKKRSRQNDPLSSRNEPL